MPSACKGFLISLRPLGTLSRVASDHDGDHLIRFAELKLNGCECSGQI